MSENPFEDTFGEVRMRVCISEAKGRHPRHDLLRKIAGPEADEECKGKIEFKQPLDAEPALPGWAVEPCQRAQVLGLVATKWTSYPAKTVR